MAIKRILIPTDFSDTSLHAVDYAAELSKVSGATLTVLFVVEPLYYAGDLGLMLEEHQRFGKEQLATVAARLKRRGAACRLVLRTGTPYQVIVDEAKWQKADLIIMGTHGRTGLSHLLLGSVTEKVVRTATTPVLTVPWHRRARRR